MPSKKFHREVIIDGHTMRLSARPKSKTNPLYIIDYYLPNPERDRARVSLETRDPAEAEANLEDYIKDPDFFAEVRTALEESAEDKGASGKSLSLKKLRSYYVDTRLVNINAAHKTIMKAEQVLDDFRDYASNRGVTRINGVNRALVDGYTSKLVKAGLHPKTVHTYLAMIRAAINAAVDGELIESSPIRKWAMPKIPDSEIEPLTSEDLAQVLQIISEDQPDYYPIVAWIALTGNRPSDARDLRFRQVDLKTRTVQRTQVKVKRLAKYDISKEAAGLVAKQKLKRRPKAGERVFLDPVGKPMTSHQVYHQFTRALARRGFHRPVNLKDLRHTFGYLLANDSDRPCALPKLQQLMGHSDIKMTMRYVASGDAREEIQGFASKIKLPGV